ncbi:MAG: ABC transporter substrate-binding protein [Patescibacteria group bacterium]
MKNLIISGALAVAGISLLGYAVFGQQVDTTRETIQIGVVYGLTGPAASWTDYGKKALEMAVEEINAGGGVGGRMLVLVIEDSKTNPASSASAFQKLIDADNVDVIVGDVWSFITNPLISIADNKRVVLISPTVMDKSIEGESDYFYTLGHTVGGEADAVRTFFDVNSEIKTASILCWNDAWGKAHSVIFREIAAEKGVHIVGEECTGDFASDYRTEMGKIKVQDADALLLTASYPDVALRAYTNLEMTQKVLTLYIADAVELRDMPRADAQNVWFIDWMPSDGFVEKFKAKYGVYPILEAQNHYDVVYAIAHALENNPDSIVEGLKTVKFEGVDGVIDFAQGDNITVNKSQAKLYRVNLENGYTEVK